MSLQSLEVVWLWACLWAPESAYSFPFSAAEVILASVQSVSYDALGAARGSSTANTPETVSCLCKAERLKTERLRSRRSSEQCVVLELFSDKVFLCSPRWLKLVIPLPQLPAPMHQDDKCDLSCLVEKSI